MPTITFPLEITETILELLAEDDKGHLALKTCSLVCRAFLPICRKHTFESIVLNDSDVLSSTSHGTTYAFGRLLHESPEIADYIRKLDYTICGNFTTSSMPPESLERISRLEFLSVRYHYWPGQSEPQLEPNPPNIALPLTSSYPYSLHNDWKQLLRRI